MNVVIQNFFDQLKAKGVSTNTIENYVSGLRDYIKWFDKQYNITFKKLYRENIVEYIKYLKYTRKNKRTEEPLNAKTINLILEGLIKYNRLIQPDDIVITPDDLLSVQQNILSPAELEKKEVETFRQCILQSEKKNSKRDYTMVTMIAYSGLRMSEILELKLQDIYWESSEMIIRGGKGDKQRSVIINSTIKSAVKSYLQDYPDMKPDDYLFPGRKDKTHLHRSVVNKALKGYVDTSNIYPRALRHFFCSNALDNNYTVAEVAQQAGHASFKTTMTYLNPSKKKMRDKAENL